MKLEISKAQVAETVAHLRASSDSERVVLWLGRRHPEFVRVHEVFLPHQIADSDYFKIPSDSMDAIFRHMREERLMIAAQVHTHPEEAFHSWADDKWSIVRHEGGLSLVMPRFCQETSPSTFVNDAKVFRLDARDQFVEVGSDAAYVVTP